MSIRPIKSLKVYKGVNFLRAKGHFLRLIPVDRSTKGDCVVQVGTSTSPIGVGDHLKLRVAITFSPTLLFFY